ncbi:LD-carboxypeptidase [Laspinema sp. D1]|uniref:S66 peptidase family protein n=1 Tax=Laspinema palackyanum TaxID=3231601 RepID=UPI00348B9CFC|nr:LD-carboxypeptidase [Laspinema sp. D2b]
MASEIAGLNLNRVVPPALKPGDLLRAVAPSGALREQSVFEKGLEIWRSRGYRVELTAGYDNSWGYLAGTDCDRRQQLAIAWQDPECRAILCVRGGYGGARILEDWTWTPETTPPKWVIGFSDITSLLWSLSKTGIVGVHGPLLTTIASEPDWTISRLFDLVEGKAIPPLQGNGWGNGTATGYLLPANLTVATHLLGTPAQPLLEGAILAFEDVGEAPYRIDRMLTQWRMMGAFRGVRGIALGRFSQCDTLAHKSTFTVSEVLRDRLVDLDIPIVSDLPFGHDGENAALPVGVPVELDGDRGSLSILAG